MYESCLCFVMCCIFCLYQPLAIWWCFGYLKSVLGHQIFISWWYWIYHKLRHWACRGFGTGSVAAIFNGTAASFISWNPKSGTASSASFLWTGNPNLIAECVWLLTLPHMGLWPQLYQRSYFLVSPSDRFWTSSSLCVSFLVQKDIYL